MSTDTRIPVWLEEESLVDRVEELTGAVRHLAVLRVAERELPQMIDDAIEAVDAAAMKLGLCTQDIGEILVWEDETIESAGAAAPPAEAGPAHPAEADEPGAPETPPAPPSPEPVTAPLRVTDAGGGSLLAAKPQHEPERYPVDPPGFVPDETIALDPPAVPAAIPATPDPDPEPARPAPAPTPERAGGRPLGDVSQACLRMLELTHPYPATAADIVAGSGYSLDKVRRRLYALSSSGRIVRDDSRGEPLWSLAADEPTPVVSAALAAAGEVAP